MMIVRDSLKTTALREMAPRLFGNMVKAVVDIDRGLLAIDAELHSDLEAMLLDDGSAQHSLWGINLYPEMEGGDFIEFDSMINVRPSRGNRSRGVEDEAVRAAISRVVNTRVVR